MYFSRRTLRTTVLDSRSAGGDDGASSIIVRHFVTRIDHHHQLNAACTTAPPQIPTLYLASAMRYLLYYSALSPARRLLFLTTTGAPRQPRHRFAAGPRPRVLKRAAIAIVRPSSGVSRQSCPPFPEIQ